MSRPAVDVWVEDGVLAPVRVDVVLEGPLVPYAVEVVATGGTGPRGADGSPGPAGPAGVAGADLTAVERRHDWVSGSSTAYCGTAPEGTSEDAASWALTRIIVAGDGTVTTAHATGSWTGRAAASYS